ncbi:MAG: hypothetical protein H6833_10890 [Planctomycetes bacterium]|nr:hypothetical protein [Planctomycetota bacterium]
MKTWPLLALLSLAGCCSHDGPPPQQDEAAMERKLADDSLLDELLAQYAPHEFVFDARDLPARDKALLRKLVEASEALHEAYLRQTSVVGMHDRDALANTEGDSARKAADLLRRNAMPYDLLRDHVAFIGDAPYPPGHDLYPHDLTADAFDAHVATLDEEERRAFLDPYTAIRRTDDGGLEAVPYHVAFHEDVTRVATRLREAADLTDNASFQHYLRTKADALENDEYFETDCAWIDLEDNAYDVVIGPFETYSDGIKGVKAKYECYVEIVDREESAKLEVYTQYLPRLEANLPIPEAYRSNVEGLTAKFVIVRDIHRGGEASAGYQSVAANLPNDARVHAEKGTVKTFWKNMLKARFNVIIRPVSERLIAEDQRGFLSDDGFFQVVLMHEICHAVGPRTVKVGPKQGLATNEAIGPPYNKIEEAKADIAGLLSLAYLMDENVIDPAREREFYVSYLGSLFRSIRFGTHEAHGAAAAIGLNYLRDRGALQRDEDTGHWSVVFDAFRPAVRTLAGELLLLLGNGDPQAVTTFLERWGHLDDATRADLEGIADLPIDVFPSYRILWD